MIRIHSWGCGLALNSFMSSMTLESIGKPLAFSVAWIHSMYTSVLSNMCVAESTDLNSSLNPKCWARQLYRSSVVPKWNCCSISGFRITDGGFFAWIEKGEYPSRPEAVRHSPEGRLFVLDPVKDAVWRRPNRRGPQGNLHCCARETPSCGARRTCS